MWLARDSTDIEPRRRDEAANPDEAANAIVVLRQSEQNRFVLGWVDKFRS